MSFCNIADRTLADVSTADSEPPTMSTPMTDAGSMPGTSSRRGEGLHVVVGARGGIGSAVVAMLVRSGRRVRAVTRAANVEVPAAAERAVVDVSTPEGAVAACAGAAVVFHCAQPPYHRWPQELPSLTDAIVEGAASAGAKLVMTDNCYAYGPSNGPLTEGTPVVATTRKGRVRAAMAARLIERHRAGELPVTIGRASDYYGPGGDSVANALVFAALAKGRSPRWMGSLDRPHTHAYTPDVAAALIVLADHDAADGEVWHLPSAEPLTGRAFLALAAEVAGVRAGPKRISPLMNRLGGLFSPRVREGNEMMYEFTAPFLVDASKFTNAFGSLAITPHRTAMADTLSWFRAH